MFKHKLTIQKLALMNKASLIKKKQRKVKLASDEVNLNLMLAELFQ